MGWHNVLRVDRIMLHLLPGVKLFAEFRHSHLSALLVVVDLDQNFAERCVHRFGLLLDEIDLYLQGLHFEQLLHNPLVAPSLCVAPQNRLKERRHLTQGTKREENNEGATTSETNGKLQ